MTDDYSRLLRPRSIAVIGGRWAAAVVEQCRLLGFEGTIWPVHPTKDHLGTEPCYRSIDQLPSVPDAAFVAVRNELTIEAVKDLADIGSGGAICFASGFSETAGRDDDAKARQQRLVDAAGSMPIVGPNCYGMINFLDRVALWPDQHGGKPIDRGVAIITQSSNIAINLSMQQRGLPIAYLMTMGNQAQTTLASMAMALLNDERVTALGLHIEGFSSIRAFESLSSFAQARGKRIVVLKTGVTPLSRAALLSHTRSLSGDDAAASAFIERLHMKRVQGLGEFIETLKVVHAALPIKGYRLFSMSCSGGEAALVGDVAEDVGLQFPPLQENQQNALRVVLGAQLQLSNPLDYHTAIWDDREAMMKMVAGMLTGSTTLPPINERLSDVKLNNEISSDENTCQRAELLADIALLILDFPRKDRCVSDSWMAATDAFIDGSAHWPGARAIIATLPENMSETIVESLYDRGVVALCGLRDGLLALYNAAWLELADQLPQAQPVWLPEKEADDVDEAILALVQQDADQSGNTIATQASQKAWGLIRPMQHGNGARRLDESTAKRWLTRFGVEVPVSTRLSFADLRSSWRLLRALDKASPTFSYPVVAKSLGLAHKSESNAVVLNIANRHELEQTIRRLDCAGGCLIEEYVDGGVAELLVGVVLDPVHGLLMTIGAGGVTTELLDDTFSCLVPASREELDQQLKGLRCAPLLSGFRNRDAADRERLLDTLLAVQNAALQLADRLVELEINPLICTADSCVAVDALVSVRDIPVQ